MLVAGPAARRGPRLAWWQRTLSGRRVVLVVALGSAVAAMAMVAWRRDPPPLVGDEASYQLQASLFAAGRWTDTTPSFPEAFQQIYVLSQPRVASKYPPGHALVLTPGYLIGFPWLMPMLCLTLSGVLVFVIGRRLGSGETGLIAWLGWLSCTAALRWRGTWYSENTTAALMLVGWWLLLRNELRRRDLALLGLVTGWLAITRPLTALAFAIPVGIVLLLRARRRRSWVPLLVPVAFGLLPLGLIPIWNWRTTGRVDETPLMLYTRQYMPWDVPGFGPDTTAPLLRSPPDQAQVEQIFANLRARHTVDRLPRILADRIATFARMAWSGWRWWLLPLGVAGLFLLPGWLSGTLLSQFLLYAFWYHPPSWSLYYLGLVPVMALAMALGLRWGFRVTSRDGSAVATADRALQWFGLIVIAFVVTEMTAAPGDGRSRVEVVMSLRGLTTALPNRSIVFVQYDRGHIVHQALVTNLAPLDQQRVLMARDEGTDRDLAIADALGRHPYRYVEHATELIDLRDAAPEDTSSGNPLNARGP